MGSKTPVGHFFDTQSAGSGPNEHNAILYLIEALIDVAKPLGANMALSAALSAHANIAFRAGCDAENYKNILGQYIETIDAAWAMMELAAAEPEGEG